MIYGFDYEADDLEKAFDIVEQALRLQGVTKVTFEYSEGVEVHGPNRTSTKSTLYRAWQRSK